MNNKENLRLWIEALRSGRFRQGQGELKQILAEGTLHCCLGVACEAALENGVVMQITEKDLTEKMGVKHISVRFGGTFGDLPDAVRTWLGTVYTNPMITTEVNAVAANDRLLWSFDQIADELERLYLSEGS